MINTSIVYTVTIFATNDGHSREFFEYLETADVDKAIRVKNKLNREISRGGWDDSPRKQGEKLRAVVIVSDPLTLSTIRTIE